MYAAGGLDSSVGRSKLRAQCHGHGGAVVVQKLPKCTTMRCFGTTVPIFMPMFVSPPKSLESHEIGRIHLFPRWICRPPV